MDSGLYSEESINNYAIYGAARADLAKYNSTFYDEGMGAAVQHAAVGDYASAALNAAGAFVEKVVEGTLAFIGLRGVSLSVRGSIKKGTFPDEFFTGKEPHQTTPGTRKVTQERYNPNTGELERSDVEYDQYGRQTKRIDHTNHGYGDESKPKEYHSNPHTHTYEYGPGYGPKGKEMRINHD